MRNTAVLKCAAATGFLVGILCAQQKPAFEVASIRANAGDDGAFSFEISPTGRLTVRNMSVWNLMREANGWRDLQMSGGPAWIKTAGFDIVAQAGGDAPAERSRVLLMLQALLEDRFGLRWHAQVREVAGYALRVAPGGPKLAPPKDGPARMQRGNLAAPRLALDTLCQIFEFDLGKPVVDQTELPGSYAIELQWARQNAADEQDLARPSLFTAVREQLGLRLDSARLPVNTFVIDEVRQPSEN